MKRSIFVFATLFVLFSACSPSSGITSSMEVMVVHVECRNDATTRSVISQKLRTAGAKNIRVNVANDFLEIEGVLPEASPLKTKDYQLLETDLQSVIGVLLVQFTKDVKPLRSTMR